MCGISGVVALKGEITPRDETDAQQISHALQHRGPDAANQYIDSKVVLSFRQLNVTSKNQPPQPFISDDQSTLLCANGQIYNYQELKNNNAGISSLYKTESDCEVLLHLYMSSGISFVDDLNGMYAIVIYDKNQKCVYFVRDRLGLKPLFYFYTDERLYFASEIKSLLTHPACPRDMDWKYFLGRATEHFEYHPDRVQQTYIPGIHSLPAAHIAKIDLNNSQISTEKTTPLPSRKYWSLESSSTNMQNEDANKNELLEEFKELVIDAVAIRAQSSYGLSLFLSSGIDSAVIAAILKNKSVPINTFTVLCPGTQANNDALGAAQTADALEIRNQQLSLIGNDNPISADSIRHTLFSSENPHCSLGTVYKHLLYQAVKSQNPHIRSNFSGDASDEFFGGYADKWINRVKIPNYNWEGFEKAVQLMQRRNFCIDDQWKYPCTGDKNWDSILNLDFLSKCSDQPILNSWHYYLRSQMYPLQMWNFWTEDRMSASVSMENRTPFADHRLIEFANKIPEKFHKYFFYNKRILRDAFKDLLPRNIRERPKISFYQGHGGSDISSQETLRLITQGKNSLLDEALDYNPENLLDKDAFIKLVKLSTETPTSAYTSGLWAMVIGIIFQGQLKQKYTSLDAKNPRSIPVVSI